MSLGYTIEKLCLKATLTTKKYCEFAKVILTVMSVNWIVCEPLYPIEDDSGLVTQQ